MLEVPGGIQDFPEGEGTNPKWRVGGMIILFGQNFEKLHETEENWTGAPWSKMLLCRSTTAYKNVLKLRACMNHR